MIDPIGSSLALGRISGGSHAAAGAQTSDVEGEFASLMSGMLKQSVAAIREGEQAAAAGIRGQAPLQEVVDKVMAAEQTLQSALAVRDKIVSAWLEISRMNI